MDIELIKNYIETKEAFKMDKAKYLKVHENFYSDLRENVMLSTLDLYQKYMSGTLQIWAQYLDIPPVQKVRDYIINDELLRKANQGIIDPEIKNKAALIQIKTNIENKVKQDNSQIVVLRMRDKYSTKEGA